MDGKTARAESRSMVKEAVRLVRQGEYDPALLLFEQHLPNLTTGDPGDKRAAYKVFSFYGLCVAMVRRRYAQAVSICSVSLRTDRFDSMHRYNLALVYLERNNRREAVENLDAGLLLDPGNIIIRRMFEKIGRRRPPVIPFLSRKNRLNIWLGRVRARTQPS